MNRNKTGLIVGFFLAIIHAIWALMVAIIPNQLQSFLNWIFVLHSLEPYWIITAFNFPNALLLVIVTFIFGYLLGYLFAAIWDSMLRTRQGRRHRRGR
jgi:uncharacterized membrane protein